jgi:hypothetical protein
VHEVPVERGAPVVIAINGVNVEDAGLQSGSIDLGDVVTIAIQGDDDGGLDFDDTYYFVYDADAGGELDAGVDGQIYFTPADATSPGLGYKVCVQKTEIDAGFGTCDIVIGGLDAGINQLCSPTIHVQ